MRIASDMPGTLPLPNTSGWPHAPQTNQTLSALQRVSASMKRLDALDDLMAVVQSTLREGRFDDETSSRILIAAGAAVNAMRAEREAISQTQKPTT
ncbi:hypothetical protein A0U92_03475 [Acetobacter aceti]|uniref:Uncharacterized protein n=1 Tax=Acetobacter aceti TaxID=435 RepID=A0A1U9KDU6_ACEAC|nr:hypothetical protein [Acetobacter aceti]AQS83981.1 hypothetical protein A0U92_03475 [Acetobacter aceti]